MGNLLLPGPKLLVYHEHPNYQSPPSTAEIANMVSVYRAKHTAYDIFSVKPGSANVFTIT